MLLLVSMGSWIHKTRALDGRWMNENLFMVVAHGLYANACAKGEHFIPYTWDIFYEKFGWMLCFWNVCGVPFWYCYQSVYVAHHHVDSLNFCGIDPFWWYTALTILLLLSYWIFDECNYQKNLFKQELGGEKMLERNLFPTFRRVKDPKFLKCDVGVILVDGWYGKARKIHYTADFLMALSWSLSCGVNSIIPYFHPIFFFFFLIHRTFRDETRCSKKYGP